MAPDDAVTRELCEAQRGRCVAELKTHITDTVSIALKEVKADTQNNGSLFSLHFTRKGVAWAMSGILGGGGIVAAVATLIKSLLEAQ